MAANFPIATVEDYTNLIHQYMEADEELDDDEIQDNYKRIANSVQSTVWNWLFTTPETTEVNENKAAELLKKHRPDACFYSPWDYNDWIVKVRDELLKRNMLRFWRDEIVQHELGTIWARNSDYFDDMNDQEPAKFYEYAGCVAPFPKPTSNSQENVQIPETATTSFTTLPESANDMKDPKSVNEQTIDLSKECPSSDYTAGIQAQLEKDENNKEALAKIFIEAQTAVWQLLFGEATLSEENFKKAADLLEAYKQDACFFAPMPYNQWIYKVRDELFRRKQLDFWQEVIVAKKCGLCCYEDSDYFDDKRDKSHIEFYNTKPI